MSTRRSKKDRDAVVGEVAKIAPDIFPPAFRNQYIHHYALKAVPIVLIWTKLTYDLLTGKFSAAVAVTKIPITHGK